MPRARMKAYAVIRGRKPGIYRTWGECEQQVSGYSNAEFKGFPTVEAAEAHVARRRQELSQVEDSKAAPPPIAPAPVATDAAQIRAPDTQHKPTTQTFYAVARGRTPGIYVSWDQMEAQARDFPHSEFRSFDSREDAEVFFRRRCAELVAESTSSSLKWVRSDAEEAKIAAQQSAARTAEDHSENDDLFSVEQESSQPSGRQSKRPGADLSSLSPPEHNKKRALAMEAKLGGSHEAGKAQSARNLADSDAPISEDNIGFRMLSSAGWTPGQGLGRENQGRLQPVQRGVVREARDFAGVGFAPDSPDEHILLDETQSLALEMVKKGRNVFITGIAGSGKSFVLRRIIHYLKEAHPLEVGITASTGAAAVLIRGQTFHSLTGCGVLTSLGDLNKMWGRDFPKRWRSMRSLIIDEVSLLSGEYVDWIDQQVRQIRGDKRPFGGIQLIWVGDFCQLNAFAGDAVSLGNKRPSDFKELQSGDVPLVPAQTAGGACALVFQSACWKEANFHVAHCKINHRQTSETRLQQLMNSALTSIRRGVVNNDAHELARVCSHNIDQFQPVLLQSRKENVTIENRRRLAQLETQEYVFEAKDSVRALPGAADQTRCEEELWRSDFFKANKATVASEIRFKVGAQVMITMNEIGYDRADRLSNGTVGIIVRMESDEDVSKRAPNVSSHALTSVRYPVVQWSGHAEGRVTTVFPAEHTSDIFCVGTCSRVQLPLILGWSVTIHKSQGQTYDAAKVDVSRCFAEGQAYVALSRVRRADRLQIIGFHRNAVKPLRGLVSGWCDALNESSSSVTDYMMRAPMWLDDAIIRFPSWLPLYQQHEFFQNVMKTRDEWTRTCRPLSGCGCSCGCEGSECKARKLSPQRTAAHSDAQFSSASRVLQAQSSAASAVPESRGWGCSTCTFWNMPLHRECAVCLCQRP